MCFWVPAQAYQRKGVTIYYKSLYRQESVRCSIQKRYNQESDHEHLCFVDSSHNRDAQIPDVDNIHNGSVPSSMARKFLVDMYTQQKLNQEFDFNYER